VFVVHGDKDVVPLFVKDLEDLGYAAHAPKYTEEYDLIADRVVKEGYIPEKPVKTFGGEKSSALYQRLLSAGDSLMSLIRRSKERDNKTLEAFISEINKLKNKFNF